MSLNTLLGITAALGFAVGSLAQANPAPLRVATFTYPPYIEHKKPAAPSGLAVEIVEQAFARMRAPMTLEVLPFPRALFYLYSGRVDALFTVRSTAVRLAQYHLVHLPALEQDLVIFVPGNSPVSFSGNLGQLSHLTIGIVHHTSYGEEFDDFVRRGGFRKLEVSTSHTMNFAKLLGGRMDAVICSRKVGLAILRQLNAEQQVKIIGPPVGTYRSYIMFGNTVPAPLIHQFQQHIAAMQRDGTLARLKHKYDRSD